MAFAIGALVCYGLGDLVYKRAGEGAPACAPVADGVVVASLNGGIRPARAA